MKPFDIVCDRVGHFIAAFPAGTEQWTKADDDLAEIYYDVYLPEDDKNYMVELPGNEEFMASRIEGLING